MSIGQSKKWSLIETLANTFVGLGIAITAQIIIFPWFGIEVTFGDNLGIALIFTVISIARSFIMRRLFNLLHLKGYGNVIKPIAEITTSVPRDKKAIMPTRRDA